MRRALLTWFVLSMSCGGGGKATKHGDATPAGVSPGLASLRHAHETFVASKGMAPDFDTLRRDVQRLRKALPPAGAAEADVILAAACARMVNDRLENAPDDEDGVLASTVIPLTYGFRMLDGESVQAFRDRLCDGPAKDECAGALPDFWGRALTYGAAVRVGKLLGDAPSTCNCDARYRADLTRVNAIAEHAAGRKDVEKQYWLLEGDPLPRSAFGALTADPGAPASVKAQIDEGGNLTIAGAAIAADANAKKRIAAIAAALGTARGATPPDRASVEIVAIGAANADVLGGIIAGAASAAYGSVVLIVRQAAPPHYRARLALGVVRGAAPKGTPGIAIGRKDTVQAVVDRVDAALGAKENVHPVFVVPR